MAKKNINSFKKKRKKRKGKSTFGILFKCTLIAACTFFAVVAAFKITQTFQELFGPRDIEDSKVQYYIDIADEVSKDKVQVNWKELLAVETVLNDGDFSEIKKNESLKIAEKFIERTSEGVSPYKIKKLSAVLDEIKMNSDQKSEVDKNMKDLETVYLGNKRLDSSDHRIAFINQMEEGAIENYKEYGILPSISISQAILESGWGSSKLSKESNNMFGIKADKRWTGTKVSMPTGEYYNTKIVANFRSYSSVNDSIKDYGKFLTENSRYRKNGLFDSRFYMSQAQALEDAGYSTKQNEKGEYVYADMLIDLIRNYNLQLIDSKAAKM
ncbi:MAG: glucosaminidase domain-containing protein [Clostridioides sp.]|nr:glucosaminidase domain-containing protein [Clostridioides sp.]